MRVDLPWPPSSLRPNASSPGAWRRKQSAAKSYKADCAIVCRASGLARVNVQRAHLSMRFCPPDRRRRDLDNMLASVKQGIDAIAESIGIDDYHFGFTLVRGEPVKGGKVMIEVVAIDAATE
jgi:crossover junction endodeoxyribonuclease RusA